MLKPSLIQELQTTKNLLAFSGGGDSTALFFLLLQNKISFDIAIVDYNQREQSKEEVMYAKELAKQYNLKCYEYSVTKIESNFEANARKIRYDFFDKLILQYNYTALLTAHHLGDRFEWMLMQFCKGAGCAELTGMQERSQREKYTLYRPLLHLDKSELLEYLHYHKIRYYEDESNNDDTYKRNYFRNNHTKPLLQKHLNGIKKSFSYLDEDAKELIKETAIHSYDTWAYFVSSQNKRSDIFYIDKYLKKEGFLISSQEKQLLKEKNTVIIARKIVVNQEHNHVFIMPYIKNQKFTKEFKEQMRILKIEPKLRGFLFNEHEAKGIVTSLLLKVFS